MNVSQYKLMYPQSHCHSEETVKRISLALMGNKYSVGRKTTPTQIEARRTPEARAKISAAKKDYFSKTENRIAHQERQKRVMGQPEVREKMSLNKKAYLAIPENKQKHRERLLKIMSTLEARTKNSLAQKAYFAIPGNKEKMIKAVTIGQNRPEVRLHNSLVHIGKSPSPETRSKISLGAKQVPHTKEWVRKVVKANNTRPNKKEQALLFILGNSWQYTGNGDLMVGNKCPDFWNGDHKLIELYGDYWHRGQNPQARIDYFKKYDYDCLIIWERELKDKDKVMQLVSSFVQGNLVYLESIK